MHRLTERIAWRILLALGVGMGIALSVAVAPGGAETARAQAPTAVSIVDFAFQPATVTVPVGGTVTWTNRGNAPHTSTSRTGVWDSGRLTSGQSFSFTFRQAGSFAYFCMIHPQMTATVVVQGAAAAQPVPAAQPTPRPPAAAPAPAAQRPVGAVAAPKAQRPAAAPAAARSAAAPQVQRAAAAPAARPAAQVPAAMPRTGTGGPLAADNENVAPAVAATAVLLLGMVALAYRRRRV